MAAVLGYGVSPFPVHPHGDLTPIVAILTGLLIARFVVGMRLTPMSAVFAAFGGALWAYLAQAWGLTLPSLVALIVVLSLRAVTRRVHRGGAAG